MAEVELIIRPKVAGSRRPFKPVEDDAAKAARATERAFKRAAQEQAKAAKASAREQAQAARSTEAAARKAAREQAKAARAAGQEQAKAAKVAGQEQAKAARETEKAARAAAREQTKAARAVEQAARKAAAAQTKAASDTERAAHQASRGVRGLERAWDGAASGASMASRGTAGLVGSLTSLKGLALGIAGGVAGKTAFDLMIGSNAELEAQTTTFNVLIGDATKAADAIRQVREYAAATPFGESELIEGSKRLLRLTGQNVDENLRLLKVAGQLKAISPSKSLEDAVEALLDAEGMEFERLKEFGIKVKGDDIKKSKKAGETLGKAALRGVDEQLTKLTGGRDVVGALSGTFQGKTSTLKDNIANTIRVAGEPAFEVLKRGIDDVAKDFAKLQADPQFKKDLKDLAEFASSLAKSSVSLVRDLPGAITSARAFVSENSTALTVAGGAYALNRVTGGAAGSLAMSAGKRALFGKGGGAGALGAAGAAASGATPVYVVNMGEGGMGGLGSGLGGAAGTAGSTAAAGGARGVLGSLASKGIVGTLGAGGTASVAAGAAFLGLQLYTLGQITKGSTAALSGFEKRAADATKQQADLTAARKKTTAEDFAAEKAKTLEDRAREERAKRLDEAKTQLDLGLTARAARNVRSEFAREQRAGRGSEFLAEANKTLLQRGVEARAGKDGQLTFQGGLVGDEFTKFERLRNFRTGLRGKRAEAFAGSAQGQALIAEEERLRQKGEAAAARARELNAAQGMAAPRAGAPELLDARNAVNSRIAAQRPVNITINAANKTDAELERQLKKLLRDIERDDAAIAAQTSPGGV